MFKKSLLYLTSLFTILFLIFYLVTPAYAQGEFQSRVAVEYQVRDSGMTHVINNISLTNLFSNIYATSYTLTLDNIEPKSLRVLESGSEVKFIEKREGSQVFIKLEFENPVLGKGAVRSFTIEYDEASFAIRTGEVWEISIPRLSNPNAFDSYDVTLSVPATFGKAAYVSPNPVSEVNSGANFKYVFGKDAISKSGISAAFGDFQVFSFTLNYHLENPLTKPTQTSIALPPDTAFQKMYYEIINPKPQSVVSDNDGNWIATFSLTPRERVDVSVSGSVQIFSSPRALKVPDSNILAENLKEDEYWQVSDSEIRALAETLKTPEAIYNYVVTTLSYDYSRVKPNVERLGAVGALANPKGAICMEFTDLFITIARAAGIPAREINGYAYTENPEIQPLSLVADVLHAWPEYYDSKRQIWIPIDPTWGSTTGGVDFFNKLDLRHFTFVIHGSDSLKPYAPGSYKLGPNPQKDVFVNFSVIPEKKSVSPKITVSSGNPIPFLDNTLEIQIENPGPLALYNQTPMVFFDGQEVEAPRIDELLPFSTTAFSVSVPFTFLGRGTPERVKVVIADSVVEAPSFKNTVIIYNLLVIFVIIVLIVIFVLVKLRKISLAGIKNVYLKIRPKKENS